ncbi:MAG: hypothetical protein RLZZ244_235, partial [Verrucomicrobiota bacterium]
LGLRREGGGRNVPIVPVWVEWGGQAGEKEAFGARRMPRGRGDRRIGSVAFGEPFPGDSFRVDRVRERLWELGERCYRRRPELGRHLGREALRGLMRDRFSVALVDGVDGVQLRRGWLLAAAIALAGEVRRFCPGRRVGVVLPSGRGAVLANLAVVLAGKVPVNLNFSAGRESVEAAKRIARLEHMITARAFEARLEQFPWSREVMRLEDVVPRLKLRTLVWRVLVEVLSAHRVGSILRLPKSGGEEESVVLFTSGSSGDPKGVVLSHRNLLGNVSQFSQMLGLEPNAPVLACLPIFHSFGSTVTLWFPILRGARMVTYPSPMDVPRNAQLIEEHRVALLCSTPTFLRGYLRKAEPAQLRSLRLVITGAERLPGELAEAFEARFGKPVRQGYGLTETSPVVSVNLPDLGLGTGSGFEVRERAGSVGKLAPGIAAQIRDPESGARLSLLQTGMLWLKGTNIFEGYLYDAERTREMVREGWLRTGDLARFDEDGFLYIEGRLTRFSKMGGEMVPHEKVEQRLMELLGVQAEEKVLAVTGVPDAAKGEALVILSTRELDLAEVRSGLAAAGLPNLWIPRRRIRVEAIPHLATGKLDLRRIREMALAGGEDRSEEKRG